MKKLIMSVALVTGLTVSGVAQEKPQGPPPPHQKGPKGNQKNKSPEERAKHGANWAEKKLGLNADQKTKWETACLERIKANEPHKEKMRGSTTPEERKAIHQQVKANNENFDKTVNGFLTPEQQAKWEQHKKDQREKHKAKMKGKGNPDEVDVHEIE